MFRSILLVLAMIGSTTTFAQDAAINPCTNIAEATRNKNITEVNVILESCRTKIDSATSLLPEITPENATKFSEAAKGVAEALGIAAKELGIATNDFLMSPAGTLLAVILLLAYAGGIIIGVPFTIFTILAMFWLVRYLMTDRVEYEMVPILWGAFQYRRKKSYRSIDYIREGRGVMLILVGFGLVILNIIVWANVT